MISKIPARALIYSALMALALMLGAGGSAQAKFNLSQVGPDYGCLLGSAAGVTIHTQLMQLHTDKKGKIESGTLSYHFDFVDEVCTYTLASGTYTIDGTTGTGNATLTWTFSKDSDGDEKFCTASFPGTTFTENFAFVIENSGKRLDLAMLDPGLSGAAFTGTDPGDFFTFGSCTKQ
jgi:hypothetical protein